MANLNVSYETLDDQLVAVLKVEKELGEAWEEQEIKIRTYLGQVFQQRQWYGEDRMIENRILWENHYLLYTTKNTERAKGLELVCKRLKIKTDKNFGFFFRRTIRDVLNEANKPQTYLTQASSNG